MSELNTATGEYVDDLNIDNSINGDPPTSESPPEIIPDVESTERFTSNVLVEDTDYIDGYSPNTSQQEILNSQVESQDTSTKLLNSIGRGVLGGAIGFGENVGALVHLVNEDLGKSIMDFSNETKLDVVDSAMKVYQQQLGEDAGYWDNFARWDVLESGVSSIVQFGVGGLGVSAGFKLLGRGLLKAGTSNVLINNARGAAKALYDSGKVCG